ncbi:MAG: glycosyltransferase, partial [Chlamydiia bacterium]|nr:glycosyltransferase [Chlamydiia bacterium]
MRILHTEASLGWGGQEIRILREMIGMRERGHHLSLAAAPGALLLDRAQQEGFTCYEVPFRWGQFHQAFAALRRIIKAEQIDLLNTHSSLDAWIAGLIGRIHGLKLIRTRHISAP